MSLSAKQVTPQVTASSIIRLLHLSQQTLQRIIYPHVDKENIQSNHSGTIHQSKIQQHCSDFRELAEIYEELREYFIVFKLKGAGNRQNLMESRLMLELFAKRIEDWSSNCQSCDSIRDGQLFEAIESNALEIVSHLHAITSVQTDEQKQPPPTGVQRSSERRSLLTQKLRQAELEELEAELILRHVRSQMKEVGALSPLNEFNTRERTAPIRLQNTHSLFQQPLNFSLEPSSPAKSRSRIKASSLLSQMSFQQPGVQKRGRMDGLGCGRCEIY